MPLTVELEIDSVERLKLESKLQAYDAFMRDGKPESWSDSQWSALQGAYQDAQNACSSVNATAQAMSSAGAELDNAYLFAAQQNVGQQSGTVSSKQQQTYQNALDAYLNDLQNPRSEQAKAVAEKFGVSNREWDFIVTSKETAEALNKIQNTQPGSDKFAEATIEFIGKGVQLYGVGAALLLEKITSGLPSVVGEYVDGQMDAYIDFTSKGSMTTGWGYYNKVNTSKEVDVFLQNNPGAIDGVNDIMVPRSMRQSSTAE